MSGRLKLPDGTSWPHLTLLREVQWRLRYGDETASMEDRLVAADAISTLLHLYEVPDAAKHLPMIRRVLREGSPHAQA